MEHGDNTGHWRTMSDGRRVHLPFPQPTFETSESPLTTNNGRVLDFIMAFFVVASSTAGFIRCFTTLGGGFGSITSALFMFTLEANVIYLKWQAGKWASRKQEVYGFISITILLLVTSLNMASFIIEMLNYAPLVQMERYWFMFAQPMLSVLALITAFYITVIIDPGRVIETLNKDARTADSVRQMQQNSAIELNLLKRTEQALLVLPEIDDRVSARVTEMLNNPEINGRYIDHLAMQRFEDAYDIKVGGHIGGRQSVYGAQYAKQKGLLPEDKTVTTQDEPVETEQEPSGDHNNHPQKVKRLTPQEKAYLNTLLTSDLTNTEISDRTGVSVQYIGRLRKKIAGITMDEPSENETTPPLYDAESALYSDQTEEGEGNG